MSEHSNYGCGRFRKIDPARPRGAENHAKQWTTRTGDKCRCTFGLVRRKLEPKFDRRPGDSECISEGLVLRQLEPHRRLWPPSRPPLKNGGNPRIPFRASPPQTTHRT